MGFFGKLFGRGDEAPADDAAATKRPAVPPAVARLTKKVTNKYGQAQERQHAIRQLADMRTPEAVSALLQRFTFRIEQTIGDEEEKRGVYDEITGMGEMAVEPLLAFLEKENAPYWACKALRALVGDEASVTHLLRIIGGMEAIFDRDIERRNELVSNLREFQDPRVREQLVAYMNDENEELRVHAVEGLAGLGSEEIAPTLIDRLLDDAETQRVKTAILNLLIEKKWKVKHRKEAVRKVIPQTFWIDDVGVIHRR
jgi:HEAT repeat protein